MIILNTCLPKSQSIWAIRTVVFWTTCSPGHRACLQTAGNSVKMKRNRAGANLSLSYRFAPVLYRYGLSRLRRYCIKYGIGFVDTDYYLLTNRVGGRRLFRLPTSHTTVRTVRYTAVQST